MQLITPPIYQCPNGHLICRACKSKLAEPKKCPQCRVKMGKIRCRALENVYHSVALCASPNVATRNVDITHDQDFESDADADN
jgi:E3 ubiquitin-protein ligase SIAH1